MINVTNGKIIRLLVDDEPSDVRRSMTPWKSGASRSPLLLRTPMN